MSSAKWRSFCPDLNVLMPVTDKHHSFDLMDWLWLNALLNLLCGIARIHLGLFKMVWSVNLANENRCRFKCPSWLYIYAANDNI